MNEKANNSHNSTNIVDSRVMDEFHLAGVWVVWSRAQIKSLRSHSVSVYGRDGRLHERAEGLMRKDANFAFEAMHVALHAAAIERISEWHRAWRDTAEKHESGGGSVATT